LYLCAVFNRALRGLVQGDDQRVEPVLKSGTCSSDPPRLPRCFLPSTPFAVDKHWLTGAPANQTGYRGQRNRLLIGGQGARLQTHVQTRITCIPLFSK